jgi:molybdopterin synthase catalytic subunit
MIIVQQQAFDVGAELARLKSNRTDIGGTAIFVGSVRDMSEGAQVSAMTLEHYPGMTEKALADIETEARTRFAIDEALIIHRYGTLQPGEDIVLVITCSAHREAAFAACEFLMDWLKTKAPFWKLEAGDTGVRWVDSKTSDDAAARRWDAPKP